MAGPFGKVAAEEGSLAGGKKLTIVWDQAGAAARV